MSESLRILIVALVLLVSITLAWFFLIYRPQHDELMSVRDRTQTVLSNIQSFRATSRQVAQLDTKIADLKRALDVTATKLVRKKDLSKVVVQLQRSGIKHGLEFDKIIPDYSSLVPVQEMGNMVPEIMSLTLHMRLRGRYKNLGRFLEHLDSLPFAVSLGELSLAYNERLFPELEILVDAILYVRNDSGTDS